MISSGSFEKKKKREKAMNHIYGILIIVTFIALNETYLFPLDLLHLALNWFNICFQHHYNCSTIATLLYGTKKDQAKASNRLKLDQQLNIVHLNISPHITYHLYRINYFVYSPSSIFTPDSYNFIFTYIYVISHII